MYTDKFGNIYEVASGISNKDYFLGKLKVKDDLILWIRISGVIYPKGLKS